MSANSSTPSPTSGSRLHDEEDDNDLTAGLDLGFDGAEDLLRVWRQGLRPDPNLTVSEWADQHRWLSSRGAAEPGRYRTARHEVFFGPYRDKSKRLGLWANLCPWCHQNGVTAVHTNREADLRLKKWAQKKAMEHYGWPEARFIQEFGRSYL